MGNILGLFACVVLSAAAPAVFARRRREKDAKVRVGAGGVSRWAEKPTESSLFPARPGLAARKESAYGSRFGTP